MAIISLVFGDYFTFSVLHISRYLGHNTGAAGVVGGWYSVVWINVP